MNTRLSVLFALLFGGLIVLGGCSGGNPNVGAAEDAIEEGNYDQAVQSAQAALDADSSNAEAHMLLARAYSSQAADATRIEERKRLYRQAREAQENAVKFDPGMRSTVQNARSVNYLQEMQKGVEAFNAARQSGDSTDYADAASFFAGASAISPDSVDAQLNEAYALLNAGQQEASVEPLEAYVSRADSVGENPYVILGQLYLTNDRADDAVTVLQEATQTYPQNEELQSLLLNAFTNLDDEERAMEAYQRQIDRNPNNAMFRYNYGSMLLTADRFDEAIEQLQVAKDLDSDNPRVFFNLGAAHINKAAAIDDSIATVEDQARQAEREVSSEEVQTLDSMADQRREQFQMAITPLERAYQLTESGDEYRQDICRALFQAYVNTDQQEEANKVESCAGMGDSS